MKPLEDQTHYEALEVSENASREQVERAYRVACATYADDSLALYSMLDGADVEGIRERIALAYRVLADPVSRSAYDAELGGTIRGEYPTEARMSPESAPPPVSPKPQQQQLADVEAEDPETNFDGLALRRARLRRGVEIEQIASETKINPSYLRFIEEETFSSLPAPVYIRGFVMAYARSLNLDVDRVAACYMARIAEADEAKRPGRRLLR